MSDDDPTGKRSGRTVTVATLKQILETEREEVKQLLKVESEESRSEYRKNNEGLLKDITKIIDDRLGLLSDKINAVENSVLQNASEISQLKSAVNALTSSTTNQQSEIESLKTVNKSLQSLVDDLNSES